MMTSNQTQGQIKKCPKCQEEIQINAKKCKHCNTDLRNFFVKHKVITAVMAFMVLLVIGAMSGDSNKQDSASEATENGTKEGTIYSINDDVIVENMKIRVTNVKNLGSSIDQSYGDAITTSGTFIRVDYEIENLDNEAHYMGDIEIVDSSDRTFDESDQKYSILGDDAEFLDELNPNVQASYSTVFDIAKGATDLELKVSSLGLFSTDYVLIDLDIDA